MPYCPRCRAEYRASINSCAHCEVELVETLPEEGVCASQASMAAHLRERELVAILAGGLEDVLLVQELLRAHGIPTMIVQPEHLSGPGMHSVYQLALLEENIEQARTIYTEHWHEGLALEGLVDAEAMPSEDTIDLEAGGPIDCPACNETFSPQDERAECPSCGLMLGV